MPDPRFYEARGPVSLEALAEVAGARLANEAEAGVEIMTAAPLGRADRTCVSYLLDRKLLPELQASSARACFIPEALAESAPQGCVVLITPEPQAAYARAASYLHHARSHPAGSSPIHPDAEFEENVVIGPGVVVGPGAKIGRGTVIGPNAVIGPGVAIGRDCNLGSNTTINFALIGDRVRLLPGAVIGAAGFGVAASSTGAIDVPQLGRVILQDGVTVGACSCIDRGAWDDTVVGENSKLDNLVQVAHNVRIGRSCVFAAQAGIAGSTTIGDYGQFGGKSGTAEHLVIGDRVRLAAGALTMRDIPSGETWCGVPARPIRQFMRELAWVSRRASTRGKGEG